MKVRIYKSPDGNGKYLNKTGQFLKKAQLGGVPAESEMGYPGSSSKKKEATQEELVELIANDLSNNIDDQTISYKLATFYDLDPMTALNLVSQVKEYIESQDVIDYDAYNEDEEEQTTDEEDAEEEDLLEAEAVLNGPGQDLDEASNEIANSESIATQDDGYEDDMFNQYQSNQDNGYSYGGLYKAEDGAEASEELINPDGYVPNYPFDQTRHEITFPGIETYLPYNMSDFLNGTVDPATGNYINNLDESEEENVDETEEEEVEKNPTYAEDEQYYEENNIPKDGNAYGDYEEGDIIDPALDPSIIQMKKGGNYKRNKKAYVNSIIKLSKKADGGEEVKSDEDPEAGDPTGAKIRKQKLNNFIGSLKKETEMFTLRKQAEKQYDQMMQQQQQPQNDMMRRGGPAGSRDPKVVRGNELRYRANQLRDFLTGQNRRNRDEVMYNYNQQSVSNIKTSEDENYDRNINNKKNYYDYPSYRVDVKKSNWLTGRPSKYSIDFYGYSPLVDIANGNNPGVISQKPNSISSQNTKSSIIATTINKSQSTDLQHDYFKTDANGDKIPDYLQPLLLSGLPIDGTLNLDVPVVIANTQQEIAKAKKLENNKTKQLIVNKQAKKIAEAQKQVELEKQILEAQRQVQIEQRRLNNQEQGGFVDSENPNLYEFNYGGYDPSQQDIDYSNSIDTTDPYFQRGGGVRKFIEDYFPGNIVSPKRTYRNEIQRVYDPRTGKTIVMPMDMGNLSRVHIDKTRFWSGRPKKYTMYFNESTGKPIINYNNNDAALSNRERRRGEKIPGRQRNHWWDPRWAELETERSDPRYPNYDNNNVNVNTTSSQTGRDRFCSDFPNSPRCQGVNKKPVRNNYPENNYPENNNSKNNNSKNNYQGKITDENGKLVRDREGNWYDKNGKIIPNKQTPTEYNNQLSNDNKTVSNNNQEPVSNEETVMPKFPTISSKNILTNKSSESLSKAQKQQSFYERWGFFPNEAELANGRPLSFNDDGENPETEGYFMNTTPYEKDEQKVQYEQFLKDRDAKRIALENNPPPLTKEELKEKRDIEILLKREEKRKKKKYEYGGDLDMFIPRAENGFQTPVSPGECPMGSTKNTAGDCVDFTGKVVKKRSTGSDFGSTIPEIKQPGVIDKNYTNPLTGEKPGVIKDKSGNLQINEETPSFSDNSKASNDPYAIDVENKSDKGKLSMGANADTSVSEGRLQTFNAGVDMLDSIRRGSEANKAQNEMYNSLSSNNLYASKSSRDRGDYDTNSGLFRPDEMGQVQSSQYGGYIDEEEYYNPYLEEDEEDELTYARGGEKITYMSEDQIRAFMAEGGQVEFL